MLEGAGENLGLDGADSGGWHVAGDWLRPGRLLRALSTLCERAIRGTVQQIVREAEEEMKGQYDDHRPTTRDDDELIDSFEREKARLREHLEGHLRERMCDWEAKADVLSSA